MCFSDLEGNVHMGLEPNEKGSVLFTSVMAKRINTYIAHQELPDKEAETPAYTCQALHEESFEIHTHLHIARAKLCPTNTHTLEVIFHPMTNASIILLLRNTKTQIAVARKPNQSDVSK